MGSDCRKRTHPRSSALSAVNRAVRSEVGDQRSEDSAEQRGARPSSPRLPFSPAPLLRRSPPSCPRSAPSRLPSCHICRPQHAQKLPILTKQEMDAKCSIATGYDVLGTTHQAVEIAMAVLNSLRGRARREKSKESNRTSRCHVRLYSPPRSHRQFLKIRSGLLPNPAGILPATQSVFTRGPRKATFKEETRHAHTTLPDRF